MLGINRGITLPPNIWCKDSEDFWVIEYSKVKLLSNLDCSR